MNRPTRVATVAATVLLGLSGLAACSSKSDTAMTPPQSSTTSSTPPASGHTHTAMSGMIMITSFAFAGPGMVKPGAKVMVMNEDSEAHTVTSDSGKFDVKVDPGKTVTFTAPKMPGTYPYHCSFHSQMHGSLKVG
jgi:plastocyanin